MIFRTLIAPAFAAMTAIQPVSAMQQVPAGFAFINNSDEGDLYFGKPIARSGQLSFIQMYTIQADGTTSQFTSTFDCGNTTYKSGDGTWKPVNPQTVGIDWFTTACR